MHTEHLLTHTGSEDPEDAQFRSPGVVYEDTLEECHVTQQGRDDHVRRLSCPFPRFGLVARTECQ